MPTPSDHQTAKPTVADKPSHAWLPWAGLLLLLLTLSALAWGWLQPPRPPQIPALPEFPNVQVRELVKTHIEALRDEPWSAEKWGETGFALQANGYEKEALPFFAQAETLDPDDPRWPYAQGLLWHGENLAKALPFFERSALRFKKNGLTPRWRLATSYYLLGRLDEAEVHFKALAESNPDNGLAWLGLGRIAYDRRQLDKALELLGKAANSPLSLKESLRTLALVHRDRKETKEAELAQAKCDMLPEDPNPPDPLSPEVILRIHDHRLIQLRVDNFIKGKSYANALELLERLLRDHPKDAHLLATQGRVLILHGMDQPSPQEAGRLFTEGQKKLEQARKVNPQEAGVDYFLGLAYLFQYDSQGTEVLDKAKFWLETAWKSGPNNPDYSYSLASCLVLRGELKEAQDMLRGITEERQDSPANFLLLGDCLGFLGDIPESYRQYRHAALLGGDGAAAVGKLMLLALQQKL